MRSLLRSLAEPVSNVVVVCDNAPCHCELEAVFDEEEFEGGQLLRLGPYSAPLNPIEEVWNVTKSYKKQELSQRMPELLNSTPPPGKTWVEHKLNFLEQIIDNNFPSKATLTLCVNAIRHVKRHYSACLQREDLRMGDIPRATV